MTHSRSRRAMFGALGAAALGVTLASTANAQTPPSVAPALGEVDTIADLKALTPPSEEGTLVYVAGYYSAGDGGGGWFRMASSGSEDGGLCIKWADGEVYWHRMVSSTELDVMWFGVRLGNVTDAIALENTVAVKAAAMAAETSSLGFGVVRFPRGQLKLRIREEHLTKTAAYWSLFKITKDGMHHRLDGTEFDIVTEINDESTSVVQTLWHAGYGAPRYGFHLSGGFIRMTGPWRYGPDETNLWQVIEGLAHDSVVENLTVDGVPRLGELVAMEIEGRKISRNVFRNLTFLDYGAGGHDVWLRVSGNTLIEHCFVSSRQSECSHAIYTAPERDIVVRDCTFDNCAKTTSKMVISYRASNSVDFGPLLISGCTFRNSGNCALGYTQAGNHYHDIKLIDSYFDDTELWCYNVNGLTIANCNFKATSAVRLIECTRVIVRGVSVECFFEAQRSRHLNIDMTVVGRGYFHAGGAGSTLVPTEDLTLTLRGSDLENISQITSSHGLTRARIHADLNTPNSRPINLSGPLDRVTITGHVTTTSTWQNATLGLGTQGVQVNTDPSEVSDLVLRDLDCYGGTALSTVTDFSGAILRGCRLRGSDVPDQN